MNTPLPVVGGSRKGEERLRSGHLWVFGDDLRDLPRDLPPGSWVRVLSWGKQVLDGFCSTGAFGLYALAGGVLATASCTQLVDVAKWKEALRAAAADARVDLQLLAMGGQPPDHPVLLGVPETEYLKFAVYRKRSS